MWHEVPDVETRLVLEQQLQGLGCSAPSLDAPLPAHGLQLRRPGAAAEGPALVLGSDSDSGEVRQCTGVGGCGRTLRSRDQLRCRYAPGSSVEGTCPHLTPDRGCRMMTLFASAFTAQPMSLLCVAHCPVDTVHRVAKPPAVPVQLTHIASGVSPHMCVTPTRLLAPLTTPPAAAVTALSLLAVAALTYHHSQARNASNRPTLAAAAVSQPALDISAPGAGPWFALPGCRR